MTTPQEFVNRSDDAMRRAVEGNRAGRAAYQVRRDMEAARTYAILAAVQATIEYGDKPNGINVSDIDTRIENRVMDRAEYDSMVTPAERGTDPIPPPVFMASDSIGDMIGKALSYAREAQPSTDVLATIMHELTDALTNRITFMADHNRRDDVALMSRQTARIESLETVVAALYHRLNEEDDDVPGFVRAIDPWVRIFRSEVDRAKSDRINKTVVVKSGARGGLAVRVH